MTSTITTANYRRVGVTDESHTCECCGRSGLRRTVVLAVLDTDGTTEDYVYYGVDCAARALGVRGGHTFSSSVEAARDNVHADMQHARARLAMYGLPETGDPDDRTLRRAALVFRRNNWTDTVAVSWEEWQQDTLQSMRRWQQTIRDAAALGL